MANNFDQTTWQRLEFYTTSDESERPYKAEVRDPLWMLARQWQMGEFIAEDNGSPAFTHIKWEANPIQQIALNGNTATPYQDNYPMEAIAESVVAPRDLMLRVEMGRQWVRMLKKHYSASVRVINKFKASDKYQFKLPDTNDAKAKYQNAELLTNREYMELLETIKLGQLIDGGQLYDDYIKGTRISKMIDTQGEKTTDLNKLLASFVAWFEKQYTQPKDDTKDGWEAKRLEYKFELSRGDADLVAEEYYHGHLDWYAFDLKKGGSGVSENQQKEVREEVFIPASVEYGGMPNARWWAFEDRRVNFGGLTPKTTELSKLAYMEFGLVYSNDWFVFPVTLNTGTMVDFKEIIVTDVFGQKTKVIHYDRIAGQQSFNKNWNYLQLAQDVSAGEDFDDSLFMPAVAMGIIESKPIEQVNFIRDELSNMAWGIEKIIPNNLGGGVKGKEAAIAMDNFFISLSNTNEEVILLNLEEEEIIGNEAKIRYQLANTVPENWIPFIPIRTSKNDVGDISENTLQRAAMPRIVKGFDIQRVRPRTSLLRKGIDEQLHRHYHIFDEEVPRSGVIVNGTWQRTRWYDGRIILWYGYRKLTGRGEGQSNLLFDQILNKENR